MPSRPNPVGSSVPGATPRAQRSAGMRPLGHDPVSDEAALVVGALDAAPRVDQVIEGLILLIVLFLALSFGGVLQVSHLVLVATAGVIAALFAVRCFVERGAAFVWSWAYAPAGAFLALVALQVVPLPMGVVEVLSPRAAELWSGPAEAPHLEPTSATLSLYPYGTWTDVRVLLAALTLFFVGVNIYRDRAAFRRLLAGLGLIGLAIATIGITQVLLGATKIYWLFESPVGLITAGPFASYSHYSEFLNLTLGCALGFLLVRALERSHGRPIELRDLVDLRAERGSWLDRALALFLVLGIVAIALSTSRNGLISLAFAGTLTAVAMQLTGKVEGVGWPLVGLATVAFVALLFLGIDPIYDRMSDTLGDPVAAFGARADLARDTFAMAQALPFTGAGFGTYWVSFPMFDTAMRGGTAANAENQYLEFLAETGFLGGLCVLAGLVFLIAALVRLARSKRSRIDIAGFGLAFGIAAIAFHSTTDFGLEIPAVGVLTCVIASAALARAATAVSLATRPRFSAGCVAVVLAATLGASVAPTYAAHRAERANVVRDRLHTEMAPPNFRGTPQQHHLLTATTEAAFDATPTDVQVAFWRVLHTWTNAVAHALDYGEPKESVTAETNPELVEVARRVQADLLALHDLAPTFGPAWSVAGQLGLLWLDDPHARLWIQRGRELAPHHPSTVLASGVQRLLDGDDVGGMADLERAAHVGASRASIVNLLAWDVQRPDLAYELARGKRALLELLAKHLGRLEGHDDLRARVTSESNALLEAEAARGGASPEALAQLARLRELQGNPTEAIGLYHRVLVRDPDHRSRYDLARLLAERDEPREAMRQLRDLLGLHPDHGPARALLERLERESAAR